jgi:hypothetical protein
MPLVKPHHPAPAVARLLEDEAQALAGYPVQPLVRAWLTPPLPSDPRPNRAAGLLLQHVLTRWTGELARQSAEMAQAGSSAVVNIGHCTAASHDALTQLLALVEQTLVDDTTAHAAPGRFVRAIDVKPEVEPTAQVLAKRGGAARNA